MRQFQECLLHHIQRRRAKLKPVCEKGGDIRRLAMAFEGCTDDRGATVEVMHGAIVLIPKRGPPGVGSALKPGQCLRCCTGCILGFAAPITRGFCDLPSPKRCRPARRGTAGGGPRRIRTPDPLIRSQVLYPAELSVHACGPFDPNVEGADPRNAPCQTREAVKWRTEEDSNPRPLDS